MGEQRRIVCAAVRHPDGRIVCGPRHLDDTMWAHINNMNPTEWKAYKRSGAPPYEFTKVWGWKSDQGFIDQYGAFLTREEAWPIADAAGQIIEAERNWQTGRLHSEHLY